jgi:hypothetical protein
MMPSPADTNALNYISSPLQIFWDSNLLNQMLRPVDGKHKYKMPGRKACTFPALRL